MRLLWLYFPFRWDMSGGMSLHVTAGGIFVIHQSTTLVGVGHDHDMWNVAHSGNDQ
jgi:hypothetical protein